MARKATELQTASKRINCSLCLYLAGKDCTENEKLQLPNRESWFWKRVFVVANLVLVWCVQSWHANRSAAMATKLQQQYSNLCCCTFSMQALCCCNLSAQFPSSYHLLGHPMRSVKLSLQCYLNLLALLCRQTLLLPLIYLYISILR